MQDVRFYRISCLTAVAALMMVCGYAADEKTSVMLTAQQVMPGNQAYVTVMLTNNPAVDVSQIQERVEFPKDKLTYVSSRLSIAGDLAEAELKAEIEEKSDKTEGKADAEKGAGAGNISVLVINIKGKRPIPDGPVAEITFKVPATLSEQTVKLGHRSEVSSPDGKKIAEFVFEDGSIKISKETPPKPPAIMSCFFYMH